MPVPLESRGLEVAKRVCQDCPKLITSGTRCPECATKYEALRMRLYDDARPSARKRGYDKYHEEWRAKVLARDPVCQGWPHGTGCGKPTNTADHIIPIRQGGKRFSLANGRGMCESCHNRKRQEESRQYGHKR